MFGYLEIRRLKIGTKNQKNLMPTVFCSTGKWQKWTKYLKPKKTYKELKVLFQGFIRKLKTLTSIFQASCLNKINSI